MYPKFFSVLILSFYHASTYFFASSVINVKTRFDVSYEDVARSVGVSTEEKTLLEPSDSLNALTSYNPDEYEKALRETLKVNSDEKTGCHTKGYFFSGLNNQLMTFIGITFMAHDAGLGQVLEEGISWKDTHGTANTLPHSKLWDVVHWNTFHPIVPRFVRYDADAHPDIDVSINYREIADKEYLAPASLSYNVMVTEENITLVNPRPYVDRRLQGAQRYRQTLKAIDSGNLEEGEHKERAIIYETILKSALRPHPFLQVIVDKEMQRLKAGGKYMSLHLRVEPDMMKHPVCRDKKVRNATDVVDALYSKFPEPPVNTVLLQFSRNLIEREARKNKNNDDENKILNDHNLEVINTIIKEGMWGGKVKVVEAGSAKVVAAGNPYYEHYSTISGGIVNLFLGVQADVFVGTEVSTFSTQAINSRFYREKHENFFYRPDGVHLATPLNKPHRFIC